MRRRVDLDLVLEEWSKPENWGKPLVDVCKQLKYNYNTVYKKASLEYGMPEFKKMRDERVKEALIEQKDVAYKALLEKVRQGNMKAIELYLRMIGELSDRIEVSGSVNITLFTKRQIITKKQS